MIANTIQVDGLDMRGALVDKAPDKIHEVTILYVESDEVTRNIISSYLASKYKKVAAFSNIEEAIEYFANHSVDLVITLDEFDDMDGVDLLSIVRRRSWDIPLILMSEERGPESIIKFLNMGVTQYLNIPTGITELEKSIELVLHRVVLPNIERNKDRSELKELKSSEEYFQLQQELAFLKELHTISNDFNSRFLEISYGDETIRWGIDLLYRAMDITSGDGYSIHDAGDGKVFCFIVDAMGKGISASVTSMLSTTFINYLVKNYHSDELNMADLIKEFFIYIQRILLSDEILSAVLLLIDLKNETVQYSNFGMPKIYLQSDVIHTIKCNNLPIMRYNKEFNIDTFSISEVDKIVVCSDGFTDAEYDGNIYSYQIESDLLESDFLSQLERKFDKYKMVDDITLLYIRRANEKVMWSKRFVANSTLDDLAVLNIWFEGILNLLTDMPKSEKTKLAIAFTEGVMNAFEHGNLGIDMMTKHYAINDGTYDDMIMYLQSKNKDKKIKVLVEYLKGVDSFIRIVILDEGKGVSLKLKPVKERDPMLLCGRGIEIMKQYVDHIYYSQKGNKVILIKQISGS